MDVLRSTIRRAWADYIGCIGSISHGCQVIPARAESAFEVTDKGKVIQVLVKPIVLKLTRTANSPKSQIFVTVQGEVAFSPDARPDAPLAADFKTQVGYFRAHGRTLDHIFGVHFDYDDTRKAHPVFHAQVASRAVDLGLVSDAFAFDYKLTNDMMKEVEGKIRIPTAHMDAFSVFVQLFSDHLMSDLSEGRDVGFYDKARSAMSFFTTDPNRSRRLDTVVSQRCFRADHWYGSS